MQRLISEQIKVTDKDIKSVFTKVRLITRVMLNLKQVNNKNAVYKKSSVSTQKIKWIYSYFNLNLSY